MISDVFDVMEWIFLFDCLPAGRSRACSSGNEHKGHQEEELVSRIGHACVVLTGLSLFRQHRLDYFLETYLCEPSAEACSTI